MTAVNSRPGGMSDTWMVGWAVCHGSEVLVTTDTMAEVLPAALDALARGWVPLPMAPRPKCASVARSDLKRAPTRPGTSARLVRAGRMCCRPLPFNAEVARAVSSNDLTDAAARQRTGSGDLQPMRVIASQRALIAAWR